ncbi:MAG: N-acetyltransferase family protein [Bryobacteraceae bacterium]
MDLVIAPLLPEHWTAVRSIYEQGIATGEATFTTEAPGWEAWDRAHLADCRLVAMEGPQVVGWAALLPISSRECYRGVCEVSIYITDTSRGAGLGTQLLSALIGESERHGIWMLQSVIFPENSASIRLHEKHGFRFVGRRERIAQREGLWRDTVLLERRSRSIGS